MTDQGDSQRPTGQTGPGSLGGQGIDHDEAGDREPAASLGDARPGAGSSWTPGRSGESHTAQLATRSGDQGLTPETAAGAPAETQPGSWGNRSGSGSGGSGERELDDDRRPAGVVSDDVTGTPGTNG